MTLIVIHLVRECSVFIETVDLLSCSKESSSLTISWANLLQPTRRKSYLIKSILILKSHLLLAPSKRSYPSYCLAKILFALLISLLVYVLRVFTISSYLTDYLKNNRWTAQTRVFIVQFSQIFCRFLLSDSYDVLSSHYNRPTTLTPVASRRPYAPRVLPST
jgi:phosphoglycerol transferase MdoB-like AlkP superfamily enzyme